MKVAFDSNLLLYLGRIWHGEADETKTAILDGLLPAIDAKAEIVVPFQALGECYRVVRRHGRTPQQCKQWVDEWTAQFKPIASSDAAFAAAFELASVHRLQIWDALILCVAEQADCTLLLSEDMQDGFVWGGVSVVNPLADQLHPKLQRLLAD